MDWNPRCSELCGDILVQAPHSTGIFASTFPLNITWIHQNTPNQKKKRKEKKLTTPCVSEHIEQLELLHTVQGNGMTTSETFVAASYRTRHIPMLSTSNPNLRYWSKKNETICLQNTFYMNIHRGFIQNSTKLETAQVYINRKMEK